MVTVAAKVGEQKVTSLVEAFSSMAWIPVPDARPRKVLF